MSIAAGPTFAGHALGGSRSRFEFKASNPEPRRFRVAFANLNEEPGTRIDGLGFTGAEIRRSFELASRSLPLDMIYYDNAGIGERALANADDAIRRKVDLFIAYGADADANTEIGARMKAAGIPVLAVNYPVPGAPLPCLPVNSPPASGL